MIVPNPQASLASIPPHPKSLTQRQCGLRSILPARTSAHAEEKRSQLKAERRQEYEIGPYTAKESQVAQ
jgi:hypothetical protein